MSEEGQGELCERDRRFSGECRRFAPTCSCWSWTYRWNCSVEAKRRRNGRKWGEGAFLCASRAVETIAASCLACAESSADVSRVPSRCTPRETVCSSGLSAEMGKREAEAREGSDPSDRARRRRSQQLRRTLASQAGEPARGKRARARRPFI